MSAHPLPEAAAGRADRRLLRNRDFGALVASQAVSAGGDAVSATALPLLVLALTGSGVAMGVVGAVTTLADFAMGILAGALADRGDRKLMMVGADLGRAILTALIPLSVLLGGPTMAVILLVSAPMAALRAIFRAGYLAAMPNLVGRSQLARGNAFLEVGVSVAFIVGPAIAGLLVTLIGPGETLALDALSFAISSLALLLIGRDLRAPADRAPSRIVDDIREGVVHVARHPVLRSVITLFAIASALLAPLGPAMTFRVVRDLGLAPGAFALTVTALGAGTILGSLLATRMGAASNVARVMLAAVALTGTATVLTGVIPSFPVIVVLNVISGAAESALVITYVSVRAANSPDALVGRIASTARVMALALQPIGSLVGGVLIDALGGGTTLAIFGAALAVLALAGTRLGALRSATLAAAHTAHPAQPTPQAPAD